MRAKTVCPSCGAANFFELERDDNAKAETSQAVVCGKGGELFIVTLKLGWRLVNEGGMSAVRGRYIDL